MHTVLFVQPSFQPPGGGNGLAAWMVEALRRDYRLKLCTWQPVDVESINRYWGTALTTNALEVMSVPAAVRAPVDALPLPLHLLRISILLRFVRPLVSECDLVISATNEADFGRSGIQYIHYPTYKRPRPRVDWRWYHSSNIVLAAYYGACDWISGMTIQGIRRNMTLVNSDWTGAQFQRMYGDSTRTLYPPVTGQFPNVPWEDRQNHFVCLGRIAPEKDIDSIIDIVGAVHKVHPDVHLHVIGSPGYPRYYRRIASRIAQHQDWITLHLDIAHAEVRRLIASSRYGIHAMENEHFGMAPAEMASGGCLVWVRDDGGQVEVVARDPRLIYHSTTEAVTKILETMSSATLQHSLRDMLAARTPAFSLERFIEGVRLAAAEQLARQKTAPDTIISRRAG
jgi:glycosyltransferase involved in cell wall biosynthesis